MSTDRPETRLATRLAFLVAGFGVACWAPLVPLAKHRLGVGDGAMGLLLLCLGVGSVLAMLATGAITYRYGSKHVIVGGGLGVTVLLPALTMAGTPLALGLALLLFGASLGALDAAMNVHAVEVERASGRQMMSGFHALFSIGGFAGAAAMTALLSEGVPARLGSLMCAAPMLASIIVAWPRLLVGRADENDPLVVLPRGIVLLLAALAAITFLVEGAMLDWSALLVSARGLIVKDEAGVGYILFAAAMTAGRLIGDRATAWLGDTATITSGGMLAVGGFVLLLTMPLASVALSGFVLIGLGASNIVPVLFRQAGSQTSMPASLAISAITTIGYAGVLAGPAAIGFVADHVGLPNAFWLLACLVCLVPLGARAATSGSAGTTGVQAKRLP